MLMLTFFKKKFIPSILLLCSTLVSDYAMLQSSTSNLSESEVEKKMVFVYCNTKSKKEKIIVNITKYNTVKKILEYVDSLRPSVDIKEDIASWQLSRKGSEGPFFCEKIDHIKARDQLVCVHDSNLERYKKEYKKDRDNHLAFEHKPVFYVWYEGKKYTYALDDGLDKIKKEVLSKDYDNVDVSSFSLATENWDEVCFFEKNGDIKENEEWLLVKNEHIEKFKMWYENNMNNYLSFKCSDIRNDKKLIVVYCNVKESLCEKISIDLNTCKSKDDILSYVAKKSGGAMKDIASWQLSRKGSEGPLFCTKFDDVKAGDKWVCVRESDMERYKEEYKKNPDAYLKFENTSFFYVWYEGEKYTYALDDGLDKIKEEVLSKDYGNVDVSSFSLAINSWGKVYFLKKRDDIVPNEEWLLVKNEDIEKFKTWYKNNKKNYLSFKRSDIRKDKKSIVVYCNTKSKKEKIIVDITEHNTVKKILEYVDSLRPSVGIKKDIASWQLSCKGGEGPFFCAEFDHIEAGDELVCVHDSNLERYKKEYKEDRDNYLAFEHKPVFYVWYEGEKYTYGLDELDVDNGLDEIKKEVLSKDYYNVNVSSFSLAINRWGNVNFLKNNDDIKENEEWLLVHDKDKNNFKAWFYHKKNGLRNRREYMLFKRAYMNVIYHDVDMSDDNQGIEVYYNGSSKKFSGSSSISASHAIKEILNSQDGSEKNYDFSLYCKDEKEYINGEDNLSKTGYVLVKNDRKDDFNNFLSRSPDRWDEWTNQDFSFYVRYRSQNYEFQRKDNQSVDEILRVPLGNEVDIDNYYLCAYLSDEDGEMYPYQKAEHMIKENSMWEIKENKRSDNKNVLLENHFRIYANLYYHDFRVGTSGRDIIHYFINTGVLLPKKKYAIMNDAKSFVNYDISKDEKGVIVRRSKKQKYLNAAKDSKSFWLWENTRECIVQEDEICQQVVKENQFRVCANLYYHDFDLGNGKKEVVDYFVSQGIIDVKKEYDLMYSSGFGDNQEGNRKKGAGWVLVEKTQKEDWEKAKKEVDEKIDEVGLFSYWFNPTKEVVIDTLCHIATLQNDFFRVFCNHSYHDFEVGTTQEKVIEHFVGEGKLEEDAKYSLSLSSGGLYYTLNPEYSIEAGSIWVAVHNDLEDAHLKAWKKGANFFLWDNRYSRQEDYILNDIPSNHFRVCANRYYHDFKIGTTKEKVIKHFVDKQKLKKDKKYSLVFDNGGEYFNTESRIDAGEVWVAVDSDLKKEHEEAFNATKILYYWNNEKKKMEYDEPLLPLEGQENIIFDGETYKIDVVQHKQQAIEKVLEKVGKKLDFQYPIPTYSYDMLCIQGTVLKEMTPMERLMKEDQYVIVLKNHLSYFLKNGLKEDEDVPQKYRNIYSLDLCYNGETKEAMVCGLHAKTSEVKNSILGACGIDFEDKGNYAMYGVYDNHEQPELIDSTYCFPLHLRGSYKVVIVKRELHEEFEKGFELSENKEQFLKDWKNESPIKNSSSQLPDSDSIRIECVVGKIQILYECSKEELMENTYLENLCSIFFPQKPVNFNEYCLAYWHRERKAYEEVIPPNVFKDPLEFIKKEQLHHTKRTQEDEQSLVNLLPLEEEVPVMGRTPLSEGWRGRPNTSFSKLFLVGVACLIARSIGKKRYPQQPQPATSHKKEIVVLTHTQS